MARAKRTLEEGYEIHITKISGETQPERIPFAIKMGIFCQAFNSTYRARLRDSLREEDVYKFESFVARDAEAHEEDLEHYYSQTARICAALDEVPGPELGAAIAERDADINASREKRHRSLLESLSPEGRAAVIAVLDAEIAPRASAEEIDHVALWTEFPDELREVFRGLDRFIPPES